MDNLSTTEQAQPTTNASNDLPFELSDIPRYSGSPFCEVNNNKPYFQSDELTTDSFRHFSELDSLGRCALPLPVSEQTACQPRNAVRSEWLSRQVGTLYDMTIWLRISTSITAAIRSARILYSLLKYMQQLPSKRELLFYYLRCRTKNNTPIKKESKKFLFFLKFTDICKEVAKIDLIYFNHSQGKHKNLPETADKKISKKFETFLKIKDFCKEVAKITLI